MQKILAATDYSESASNAVEYALALANRYGALISLVSAVDEPYAAAGSLVSIKEHMRDEAMETMNKVADQIRPRLENGATLDVHTVDGDPGPTIAHVAKNKGYDLIVMGNKGSTAAQELFTGSVANAAIKESELPVLTVPDNHPFRPIKRILLAADERKYDGAHVLAPLVTLAKEFDAEIIVYHGDKDGDGKGYDPALPGYLAGVNHRFAVRSGDEEINKGIEKAVKLHDADLLCMVYHDHGFFGRLFNKSTVSKVVFDSPCAMLVLRD